MKELAKDPYNIIITGVGGQGNVTASRMLAGMLVSKGYSVTIGETFGASQRGGSVMSHVRVSKQGAWSPQIPKGKADLVVSLEPSEAVKVLAVYGNPNTQSLSNDRPIYPVRVIAGDDRYPDMDEIRATIEGLTSRSFMIPATGEALKLGNPVFQNVIMIGAVGGMDVLPITGEDFRAELGRKMSKDKAAVNLKAYEIGKSLVRG
ncbi:MAG TPA: indolepyruvate oxidoreductase subunit beta [Deltaproteobacteria bacterium]|nr:indolepyruvate oxidoreductase subunit beta [Deltaproteobacteria bacterium]HPR55640.1 indolepyruvate oxidoreductase subunit beta [Deltaproteobacteria bacterium]HXK47413.1 indolepyruvate oxidoreductase subunit beta [Deltaproteobacteria bacterium]